jgi:hypothetical protein
MRNLSYAVLILSCLVPAFATSANANDAANPRSSFSPSDKYYIDSRSGGDQGQEVDNYPGAPVPSAESQMPADDAHWQRLTSGSSMPPSAGPPASSSTKTPDWPSNPTGPLLK